MSARHDKAFCVFFIKSVPRGMKSVFRSVALSLALSAMLLRALLPAGWMPAGEGDGPLVICTGHGPVQTPSGPIRGHTLPRGGAEICPFATAAHLSTPAPFMAPQPAGVRPDTAQSDFARLVPRSPVYRAQSPPAPPIAA